MPHDRSVLLLGSGSGGLSCFKFRLVFGVGFQLSGQFFEVFEPTTLRWNALAVGIHDNPRIVRPAKQVVTVMNLCEKWRLGFHRNFLMGRPSIVAFCWNGTTRLS